METQKPVCSYGESCYRKNPSHLRQMSHPHLDKLLEKMSDEDIVLPDKLDFPCTCKTLLREQLEVLRQLKLSTSPEPAKSRPVQESPKSSTAAGNKSVGETSGSPQDERRRRMRADVMKKMRAAGVAPEYIAPTGDFAVKWVLAAPYHMFFTAVPKTIETCSQPLSVTLSEILDRSLGEIIHSLHLNMLVDIGWLYAQYMLAGQDTGDLVIFYGVRADEGIELPSKFAVHQVKCPSTYGSHHCKVSVFQYADKGIRVVVSSANLYRDDWEFRTQGLWISPHLPQMDISKKRIDGDSPTHFKRDFLDFLSTYDRRMNQWKSIVARADFSQINVFFVASVPTEDTTFSGKWGHARLASILKEHVSIPESESSNLVVAQVSSIGSLGPDYESWIGKQLVQSMSKCKESKAKKAEFKLIFPTVANYEKSHDLQEASNCLCNGKQAQQQWIVSHMHQWKADRLRRNPAIPHIKTFTRMSSDQTRAWWSLLGSANLSKAAWGQYWGRTYKILSYEANVLFIPKFVTGKEDFAITEQQNRSDPVFPISYDLPLTPYSTNDKPFTEDIFRV